MATRRKTRTRPPKEQISVRGAREHNLKNIDVDIPRNQLVVVTGPSGSGKSSLAFDTIYSEGQRRYVESLSAYARQFLNQNQKPDVDAIEGLSPAISIEQKTTSRNPRSTVGTLTEIYDYLRLLFARIGTPYCYQCGAPVASQTVQEIVDAILALPEGTRFMVLAPIIRARKGEYRKEFEGLRKEGFVRARVDGEIIDLGDEIQIEKNKKHTIEIVIDRLKLKDGLRQRLTDAVELALKKADGLVTVNVVGGQDTTYSERSSCHNCGISYPELEPRLFSFNSPQGACPACDGLGYAMDVDPDKVIPDHNLSIDEGAVKPWAGKAEGFYGTMLRSLAAHFEAPTDKPWRTLPEGFRNAVLFGTGREEIQFVYEDDRKSFTFAKPFEGIVKNITRRIRESTSERVREHLHSYLSENDCNVCHGARLRPEACSVKVAKTTIVEMVEQSIEHLAKFFNGIKLTKHQEAIVGMVLREIRERLGFLQAVGLEYLSLSRTAGTLSGGEAQRIRLATQIGSALKGVIYVLDEPSIGLHQRDNARLFDTLSRLRDHGNTVLVVEHDEDTIRGADHVIDMGPGAGVMGGHVVAMGTPKSIERHKKSLTGAYLAGRRRIEVPQQRRQGSGKALELLGASGHNLKNVSVEIPQGTLTCVTGVSGSGKSTLINDTLHQALSTHLHLAHDRAAPFKKLKGVEHFDKVIAIDQSPIGRTPRSNPATYTGVFSPIRDLFAGLPESRTRGYGPGRFSFNVKGGRCEACEGDGVLRIEMHFLPDVYVPCEVCRGKRYNRETLEIHYRDRSIADVLALTVDEAAEAFDAIPAISRRLQTLQDVGLGYVALGQNATTLSGGEAQRVKLSRELSKRPTGKTIYILDEPTTGLHFADVEKLVAVLQRLVESGNTVVVIEHNLDVIKCADYIVDLGPEGGDRGGEVIATGTPEQIAKVKKSYTGKYLARMV